MCVQTLDSVAIRGNGKILEMATKVAFLSSQQIAAPDIIRCYDWAAGIRMRQDVCVMSGFQSTLEKDVLRYLLRGKVPIILVLARSMWKKVPAELIPHVENGRMVIVAPITSPRVSRETAKQRNLWILSHCSSLVLGSLNPNGMLVSLLESFPQLETLRLDEQAMKSAECVTIEQR